MSDFFSAFIESGFDGYLFLAIFAVATSLFARIIIKWLYKGNAKYNGLIFFSLTGLIITILFKKFNVDFESEGLEFFLTLLLNIIFFIPIYLYLYKGKYKGKIKEFLDNQKE